MEAVAQERERLAWAGHPLVQERPARSLLLGALVLGFSTLAALSFEGWAYGAISLGVLGLSLSRYFLPTRYLLDEQGVQVVHLGRCRRRPWSDFRRVDVHADGIFLSPFSRPRRLDAFRGWFLRFADNGGAVTDFARAHVAP